MILKGQIKPAHLLKGKVGKGSTAKVEYYLGEYEVTPKITAQQLDTQGKMCIEDVKVKEIPFYEVSNDKGKTIIIGGNSNG